MDQEQLRQLRARISLAGLSRQQVALALHLSVSALNKKLRGQARLFPEEENRLAALLYMEGGRPLERPDHA